MARQLRFEMTGRFLRNRGAMMGSLILAAVVLTALLAPVVYPGDPLRIVGPAELWPFQDARFPLGTDALGRDIAAMLAHGARTTLLIGILASAASTVIGVTVGAVAGYYGGWVDEAAMRGTELFQTIPNLIFILTIVVILGPSIAHIIIAIGVVSWTSIARLTRAEFLALRNRDFVQACRAMGLGDVAIITGEILPNALPPVIVLSSLIIAGAVLFESAVSFLGLGDPNVASWGKLIGDGRELIRTSWYVCTIPGLAIVVTVLSLNLIGDGLNDVLNPRLRDR
ncbi:MAG TPA: ABC transporter permease [Stellaceae bacterium]|jgi:peptide/nickel transport system permease protein|nr:ABC transporter permease [Stellaceae bacterium]